MAISRECNKLVLTKSSCCFH